MKNFITVSMCLAGVGVAGRLLLLAFKEYPRSTTYKRWEDVLGLVTSSAWVAWAWSVLHP